MAKTNVRLKIRGVNQVMTSRPVTRFLAGKAHDMATQAGENFEAVILPHRWTARAFIRPANAAGRKEQAENAVLERVARP